jgi:hypothetical protein
VDFLRSVPVVWDETRYIGGYPGKDAVLARRKGDTWYLAGINGENYAKELSINLAPTNTSPQRVVIFSDGEGPEDLQKTEMDPVDGKLTIRLEPYGGFVGMW